MIADGGSGVAHARRNIFDYVSSARDLKHLRNAMANAAHAKPQAVDLTFCFIDKKVSCHCHIYKGEGKYLISGWQMPDNIRNIGSYIPPQ
nr:hypothetical protein [uncultured Desulfobacter sp.]